MAQVAWVHFPRADHAGTGDRKSISSFAHDPFVARVPVHATSRRGTRRAQTASWHEFHDESTTGTQRNPPSLSMTVPLVGVRFDAGGKLQLRVNAEQRAGRWRSR